MKRAIFDIKATASLINYCFFFVLMLLSATAAAQIKGKVTVVRDPLFDTLLAKRATLNRMGGTAGSGAGYTSSYGYRLQIYSGSNRSAAYAAQDRFNREFPELRTYVGYHEPNFKVKAGDFRSRLEAEKLKAQLQDTFSAMFIVSEKINPPKAAVNND